MGTPAPQFPSARPQLLRSLPGVQRDGTKLARNNYMAAEWCRFYLDMPRKMGGYRELVRAVNGITRSLDAQTYDRFSYIHLGKGNGVERFTIDIESGLTSGLIDRTPAGFPTDHDHIWQFGLIYDTANNANLFVAHPAATVGNIASTQEHTIYMGDVAATAPLIPIAGSDVSGGIVPMWPYLLRFGNDGEVGWNVAGDITNLTGVGSGTARPWGTKLIRGLPLRGTQGPAALIWGLDVLVRVQFVGGTQLFNFDTLTTTSALLGSNTIIEHNGIYYWATVSGHSTFNGVVRDLPNDMNRQFVIDNLNWRHRNKSFAYKIPRWGEIWWCYPLFGATECNWAIIFNYQKGFWYDTPLPTTGGGLSAGLYEQIFHYPLTASPAINDDTGGTSIWQHDFGVDEISGPAALPKAIRSLFATHEFTIAVPNQPGQQGISQAMSWSLIEPDFNQKGELHLYVASRANARANTRRYGPVVIPEVPKGNQQTAKIKHTGRLTSFIFVSNTLGGHYEGGDPTVHSQPADSRIEDGGEEETVLQVEVLTADDRLREVPA